MMPRQRKDSKQKSRVSAIAVNPTVYFDDKKRPSPPPEIPIETPPPPDIPNEPSSPVVVAP